MNVLEIETFIWYCLKLSRSSYRTGIVSWSLKSLICPKIMGFFRDFIVSFMSDLKRPIVLTGLAMNFSEMKWPKEILPWEVTFLTNSLIKVQLSLLPWYFLWTHINLHSKESIRVSLMLSSKEAPPMRATSFWFFVAFTPMTKDCCFASYFCWSYHLRKFLITRLSYLDEVK